MIVTIVSDTSRKNVTLPTSGDILIHCGDFYEPGEKNPGLEKLNEWFYRQQYRYKFFVPGDKDAPVLEAPEKLKEAELLDGRFEEVESIRIFGAPFFHCRHNDRYGLRYPAEAEALGDRIPEGLDILATHLPSFGVLDESTPDQNEGCLCLLDAIRRRKPSIHAFGHDTGYNLAYEEHAGVHCYNVAQDPNRRSFINPLSLEIGPRCK